MLGRVVARARQRGRGRGRRSEGGNEAGRGRAGQKSVTRGAAGRAARARARAGEAAGRPRPMQEEVRIVGDDGFGWVCLERVVAERGGGGGVGEIAVVRYVGSW